jgi:hypothetical protein
MDISDLTAEQVRELFRYDPETGDFYRLNPAGRSPVGIVPPCINGEGYRRISILGRLHSAHRIAWLYMTGSWPQNWVDHINGDRTDNRWSNLRDVTPRRNALNRKRSNSNNLTGVRGVFFCSGRFRVQLKLDGTKRSLGSYVTLEEARAVAESALKETGL